MSSKEIISPEKLQAMVANHRDFKSSSSYSGFTKRTLQNLAYIQNQKIGKLLAHIQGMEEIND